MAVDERKRLRRPGSARAGSVLAGSRSTLIARLRPLVPDVLACSFAMVASLVIALIVMRPWDGSLRYPIGYSGDGMLALAAFQGIDEDGWWTHISRIGAPDGLDFQDYAVGLDNGNFLVVKALGLFTDWAPFLQNGFFLVGFLLVALTTYCVLRSFGVGIVPSVVGAILFAQLPMHWTRGTAHLFLGACWSVPLGAYLFVRVLRAESLFLRRDGPGRAPWDPRAWLTGRSAGTVALCALIASGGVYFAAFTLALVAAAAFARVVIDRRWTTVLPAVGIVATIGAVAIVNSAPTIVYQQERGSNPTVAERQPVESEVYSLRPIQMVLPGPQHRVESWRELYPKWNNAVNHNGEGSQYPGLYGAIGLVGLVLLALLRLTGTLGARPPSATGRRDRLIDDPHLGAFATGTAICLLLAASGGLMVLFAFFVSPQLRAPDRVAFFIAFFAIAASTVVLDRLARRLAVTRIKRIAAAALGGALIVAGSWEQTSSTFVPAYAPIKATWDSDAAYGREVESTLGGRGEVLQLPYHPFPEAVPLDRMLDYDQLRSFIHTRGVKWSYGSIKGRPDDWQEELAQYPVGRQVDAAALAGFEGVEVDHFGFPQAEVDRLERSIIRRAGPPVAVSPDGRLAFYDLRARARALARERLPGIADAVLHPVSADFVEGFSGPEPTGNRWASAASRVRIENPGDAPREVRIEMTLSTNAPATTVVRLPGGKVLRLRTAPEGAQVREQVVVPRGGADLTLWTDGPRKPAPPGETRDLTLYIVEPTVRDTGVEAVP